jgi:hypothetical protein
MIGHFAWWLAIILAFLAMGDAVDAASLTNLLSNGSFEQESNGKPVGWETRPWSGAATAEIVAEGHTGKRSALIASEKGADFSWVCNVAVDPFATYRLSAWVKTEDVKKAAGQGALLNICDFDVGISSAVTGTRDWTRMEITFSTCGQDHVWVSCGLGGWGQSTGKAWYDDVTLRLLRRYKLDYSYLFRRDMPSAPHLAPYDGQTAIAEQAFQGAEPQLRSGRKPIHWRLVCGPEGMAVDEDTGAPAWEKPTRGHHRVQIEAKNSAGHDILEFSLIVVKNDIPGGQIVATRHMDFVLPSEGVQWFEKWRPHALLDVQFEYLRKLIGHDPARDGKQIVKYQPDMGGGGCSGNPVTVGPGFWSWDDVRGWDIGIWFHEVGHNFNGQAPMVFYSNAPGFDYHHHCAFLAEPLFMRTVTDPAAFGLSGAAAANYRRWTELAAEEVANECKAYRQSLGNGGKVRTYRGDGFHLWCDVCHELTLKYGAALIEKTVRAMRTDGVPTALRETAKTPLQVNALLYCIMSHAAGADLRPYFQHMGYEYDAEYYEKIDAKIAEIVDNLPDEDDLQGWKKNPQNGHYYRRTMLDANWHAAEAEARRWGGHMATIRNARELQWLQTRFETYPVMWIGLQNAKRELDWKWISGDRARFSNWEKDRPGGGRDQCYAVLLTASGKWQPGNSPVQSFPGIIEMERKPKGRSGTPAPDR